MVRGIDLAWKFWATRYFSGWRSSPQNADAATHIKRWMGNTLVQS